MDIASGHHHHPFVDDKANNNNKNKKSFFDEEDDTEPTSSTTGSSSLFSKTNGISINQTTHKLFRNELLDPDNLNDLLTTSASRHVVHSSSSNNNNNNIHNPISQMMMLRRYSDTEAYSSGELLLESKRLHSHRSERLSTLTINKLKIPSLCSHNSSSSSRTNDSALIGREEEIKTLSACLERIMVQKQEEEKLGSQSQHQHKSVMNRDPNNHQESCKQIGAEEQESNNNDKESFVLIPRRTTDDGPQESSLFMTDIPHIVQSTIAKELVLIQGYSGVGKSILAHSLGDKTQKLGGCLVEGKFDLLTSLSSQDQPYSALAQALGAICRHISTRPNKETIRGQIAQEIARDLDKHHLEEMYPLIPELQDVIMGAATTANNTSNNTQELADTTTHDNNNGTGDTTSDNDTITSRDPRRYSNSDIEVGSKRERWKYAFRCLLRVLSAKLAPLVVVLDDCQWSDIYSLDLMQHLITDIQNPNPFMIIACYRSNEVSHNDSHPLATTIRQLKGMSVKYGFNVTDIELRALSAPQVRQMIMAMTSREDDDAGSNTNNQDVDDFANICFKRTLGNPFFVVEFMTMLDRENLISFDLGTLKWTWDAPQIENATMATQNVVDLLQTRMRKLPHGTQLLLLYAANLGRSFRFATLQVIWSSLIVTASLDQDSRDVKALLDHAEQELLIESYHHDESLLLSGNYRWCHDQIQEAALSLNDNKTERASFQCELGKLLFFSLDQKSLEEELFNVTDLVNKGDPGHRVEYAQLNCRAAVKAKGMSAFHSAAKYATKGIAMLPSTEKWTTHKQLSLQLYTLAAQMLLALGNAERAEIYSMKVLEQPQFSLIETLPLKMAKAMTLCSVRLKSGEAIDYCLQVLKELGYKLVWNRSLIPVQAIATLQRTIKAAKSVSKESYETMDRITDPRLKAISSLISRVAYAAYHTGDVMLCVLANCKQVEFMLENGLGEYSSVGIANLGNIAFVVQQDYETASYLVEMGLNMLKLVPGQRASETLYLAYNYSHAFVKPLQKCISPFSDGYNHGLRSGEIEFAMWNLWGLYTGLPYSMGKPLVQILDACPKIVAQMEEKEQHAQALCARVFWQMVSNMYYPPKHSAGMLEGDIFRASECDEQTSVVVGMIFIAEMQLLLFSDYVEAAEYAVRRGDVFTKLCPGGYFGMIETFHRGVALYAMARRTKKGKYKQPAKQIRKHFATSAKKGNPNVRHYVSFLNAEQAAMEKKYDKAEEAYQNAIVFAAKTGHLHHAALFNERYADFLLEDRGDKAEAEHHVKEAMRYYKEWGARGKVEAMRKRLL